MANRNIELKAINELLEKKFYIPNYQRGYRWSEQQVSDLLDDILDFQDKSNRLDTEIYSIQPLVVKEHTHHWEVIDGQQRLTTIYIILTCLGKKNPFVIEYQTRTDSQSFLEKITDSENYENCENIDYFHISNTKTVVEKWLKRKELDKEKYLKTILEKVQFIWYVSTEKNPITVFTRLNIGKIPLTDSELIKALLLNKSNFKIESSVDLQQKEIAIEWDMIEYTLQNDEFWLFIHSVNYLKPTRIDFIFDLIRRDSVLGNISEELLGTDDHKTFRYFNEYFKSEKNNEKFCILDVWRSVKAYFQIFEEWYNDLELYHYIGFMIEQKVDVIDLVACWKTSNSKKEFLQIIKNGVDAKGVFNNKNIKSLISKSYPNIEKEYEKSGSPKTQCRPILLLHNIQTVINQNKQLESDDKYKLPVFYKFPFHLLKKESWDVEHIDSDKTNNLEDLKLQKEWLKDIAIEIPSDNETLIDKVILFINSDNPDNFSELLGEVEFATSQSYISLQENKNGVNEKNQIWNYCLLDSSTNRGYGNAIFSAKRRIIIGKDQGKKVEIDNQLNITLAGGNIAFVPPCTKNIFMKYYNPGTNILRVWSQSDAANYKEDIQSVIESVFK